MEWLFSANMRTSTLRRCALIDHVLDKNSPLLTASQIANLDRTQSETEDFADCHIENYAQQSCRALCTAMQSKLPRELRDMIYDHILSPARDEPIFINNDYFEDVDEPYRDIVAGFAEERGYGYAHMCSEEFVDLDTMSEFARRWYYHTKLWLYLTPTEVAEFFETDIWGLGLEGDRLLRHVEVESCEQLDEDDATPLRQCLFKLAPGASIVFHLRVEYIYGYGEYTYDEEFTMCLLSERVSALFPLMRQLIEAGYELYGALDGYEDFRVTTATLDREVWKDTLMAHCEGRDCRPVLLVFKSRTDQEQGGDRHVTAGGHNATGSRHPHSLLQVTG